MTDPTPIIRSVELAAVASLQPHPGNYRTHPEDQQEHLLASMREHGVYRNVVVARDGTILAGHGVVEAARAGGVEQLPVVRLDVAADDPAALRVLAGDNEIAHLAEIDDRRLADLLRGLRQDGEGALLGTGFDDAMLANLVFVTRPAGEIGSRDDAAAWVGMPEYERVGVPLRVIVAVDSPEDAQKVLDILKIERPHKVTRLWIATWWPPRPREDLASLRFVDEGDLEALANAEIEAAS